MLGLPLVQSEATRTPNEGYGDRVIEEQVSEKRFSLVSECLSFF
jgi:hypothetical protein